MTVKGGGFWSLLRLCWYAVSKNNFLMSYVNRFGSIFHRKYNFMALNGGQIFWPKKIQEIAELTVI